MDRRRPSNCLICAAVAVALSVAGCSSGSGSTAAGSGHGRPPAAPGSSGQEAFSLDEAFLQEMSGAKTLEEVVELLYGRCDDDPSITDREGCKAAVQERLATAPVTLIDAGVPGCAARWEDGGIVLTGADCVTAFHLVDSSGERDCPRFS
jgi:hypothetical protein